MAIYQLMINLKIHMNFLSCILIVKKEIIGSDVSAFINDEKFKFDEKNNPRIMANTIKSNNRESVFGKSIFTLCGYRTSKLIKISVFLDYSSHKNET